MSVECFKKLSMVTAAAVAVVFLTLVQPIADSEIDGLFAGPANSSVDLHATDGALPGSVRN
jgi:hypothetical protein